MLDNNIQTVERIYDVVIQFLVGYSFQLFGAVVIAGAVLASWVAKAVLGVLERRNSTTLGREMGIGESR